MKLDLADAAEADLIDIGTYIARDNPDRAVSFVDELLDWIYKIPERPLRFRERNEWQSGLRSALYHGYHVVFRIDGVTVQVLRVVHGARDIDSLF